MTEKDAQNHLYELWQTGEIPHNFDENHSDYDSAIKYTIKNENFDYEDFMKSIAIIRFGIWQVEPDALVAKGGHDYIIQSQRFWETRDYNGYLVWDWLIHLAEKPWVVKESVNDLNTAFFFCQDYFQKYKPKNVRYVSTAQTLNIQLQILENREAMEKNEKINKHGIVEIDKKQMEEYYKLMNNFTYL